MVTVEILITVSVLFIAWMRYTSATQETAFEFESRLRNNFGVSAGETKKLQNREHQGVYTEVEQVIFEEDDDPAYILKRTLWPWQEVSGWSNFSIKTHGFTIDDPGTFGETLDNNTSIAECDHEHHSNHYYLSIDGRPEYDGRRMKAFDLVFYYIANSQEAYDDQTRVTAGTLTVTEADEE